MQQGRNRILGQDVVADLLLHESKVLGNVFLVLAVVVKTDTEDAVTKAEDVLVRRIFGVLQFVESQPRFLTVTCLFIHI